MGSLTNNATFRVKTGGNVMPHNSVRILGSCVSCTSEKISFDRCRINTHPRCSEEGFPKVPKSQTERSSRARTNSQANVMSSDGGATICRTTP